MHGRAPVVVTVSLGALLSFASSASAQLSQPLKVNWRQAAALATYPVYKPTRAFGLKARVTAQANGCVPDEGKVQVVANYGRRSGKGPQLGLWQANPYVCGDPGEARLYRKVRIRDRTVWVWAFCETPYPACALIHGRSHGWLVRLRLRAGKPRTLTDVEMIGSHITVRRFIRAARSLRRVKPAGSVPLSEFLSSDGSVWCPIGRFDPDDRWCVGKAGFGASVSLDGTEHLCGPGQPDPYTECTQNGNPYATRLKDGVSSDFGGYLCTAKASTITCTVKAGAGTGRGFVVSSTASSVLGPP